MFNSMLLIQETTMLYVISAILLVVVFVSALFLKKGASSKSIAVSAILIAIAFILSSIKVSPVTYGGSITLASLVPIMLIGYLYGYPMGIVCGLIYGLLQFIQSPYILTPVTFILDYLVAFAVFGVMGIFKRKNLKFISLGAVICYVLRFITHFISGVIYFNEGAVWAELPASTAVTYSLLYNAVYLIPDMIISIVVLIVLFKAKFFQDFVNKQVTLDKPKNNEKGENE